MSQRLTESRLHRMPFLYAVILSLMLPLLSAAQTEQQPSKGPNLADPSIHPYADPARGREGYKYASAPINEARLYDFYARQADYYMEGHPIPEPIPAYPGLDGGSFGHWGKNSKMDHSEDVWSKMRTSDAVGGIVRINGQSVTKAINVRLPVGGATFDPQTLSYRAVWPKGFLRFPTLRWGLMGEMSLQSEPIFTSKDALAWKGMDDNFEYKGYYQNGDSIIFSYEIDGVDILDSPSSSQTQSFVFVRTLHFSDELEKKELALFDLPEETIAKDIESIANGLVHKFEYENKEFGFAFRSDKPASIDFEMAEDGTLSLKIENVEAETAIRLFSWHSNGSLDEFKFVTEDRIRNPKDLLEGGQSNWPIPLALRGSLSRRDDAYVIDSLPVPLGNPYLSPMFLTGLSFFPNGDAAVSTFFGDVWIVSGIDETLSRVTWKRFAAGLHQPLGVEVVENVIHVLGRDQITRLHDLNNDQEADFYENFHNDFISSDGSHDFNTGLQKDGFGNLYFASKIEGLYRVSKNGKSATVVSSGIRNPNGIGVSKDGRLYTSPQEGQWTPASMIIEARQGEYYGYLKDETNREIDLPLCYVPRGIDNSTGGQVVAESDTWGPLGDQLIALSYGACSHYLVLRDDSNERSNGAIVPLKGEFLSGVHRGRIHPTDGQLYVVGTQGWGTYAQYDGSLQRVRYTGKPFYDPVGFQVFADGIRIDFAEELDSSITNHPSQIFAQQWNYQYSKGYGSPEFSIKHPDKLGHDKVEVRSLKLLNANKSVFVEIPEIQPVMQMHLRLKLTFQNGVEHKTQLFPTITNLGASYFEENSERSNKSRQTTLKPRILEFAPPPSSVDENESGRPVLLKALPGLKFDKTSIMARVGERISLSLENTDMMPHNWVLADSGYYLELGEIADQLINEPKAIETGYVPNSPHVLASIRVVDPNDQATTHFNAPSEPGTYVFLCTYPGHWRVMKGTLIVY